MSSRFDETSPNASPIPPPTMSDVPPAPETNSACTAPPSLADKDEKENDGGKDAKGDKSWPPKPGNRAGGRNGGNGGGRSDARRGDDRRRGNNNNNNNNNNGNGRGSRPGRPESPFTSFPTGEFGTMWNNGEAPTVVGDGFRPQQKYWVVEDQPKDEKIEAIFKDSGKKPPTGRITQTAKKNGNGCNTESFDPASTLVRPDFRVVFGRNSVERYDRPIKHDDVIVVPEMFCGYDDWSIYYKLVEELADLQNSDTKNADWITWHEGAHLITKAPEGSPTFKMVVDKMIKYFNVKNKSHGTRFNWYRDSSDWKPFHHDSAAFNPARARNQNITIGASFGKSRELSFIHATPFANGDKCKIYFPQDNGMMFTFGRDANIRWKHGINALPPSSQDGFGRISIILWGQVPSIIEEDGSPPMLGSDGRGPHAMSHNRNRGPPGPQPRGPYPNDFGPPRNDYGPPLNDRRGPPSSDRRGPPPPYDDRRGSKRPLEVSPRDPLGFLPAYFCVVCRRDKPASGFSRKQKEKKGIKLEKEGRKCMVCTEGMLRRREEERRSNPGGKRGRREGGREEKKEEKKDEKKDEKGTDATVEKVTTEKNVMEEKGGDEDGVDFE
ncbi:hypothetical protein TrVE_jg3898 [Triparma verrucosa]|uniref:Fe2OG dioxygenase domain-containing protein n=1 Tax=Triparma verrucosa TaxID=1606542 RepID=A0A9W7F2C5_9STRA|nr:hypothetical protein TrVE_jg3898 [Triparma verrucosa]